MSAVMLEVNDFIININDVDGFLIGLEELCHDFAVAGTEYYYSHRNLSEKAYRRTEAKE